MRGGHKQLLKWDTIPGVVKFDIKVFGSYGQLHRAQNEEASRPQAVGEDARET